MSDFTSLSTPFVRRCQELLNASLTGRTLLEREEAKRELARLMRAGKLDVPAEPESFDGRMAATGEAE